jgi:hypothetical protein
MFELAWPLVALVLGGGALALAHMVLRPANEERRAKFDAQMASLDADAEDMGRKLIDIKEGLDAHSKDIFELKKFRELETMAKLRGGR